MALYKCVYYYYYYYYYQHLSVMSDISAVNFWVKCRQQLKAAVSDFNTTNHCAIQRSVIRHSTFVLLSLIISAFVVLM